MGDDKSYIVQTGIRVAVRMQEYKLAGITRGSLTATSVHHDQQGNELSQDESEFLD